MIALRRHLAVLTWLVLSAQAFAPAFGTAQVCWPGEHTHGGVPAVDCAMHQESGAAGVPSMPHHLHGERATHAPAGSDGGAKIECRCSGAGVPLYPGQTAILEAAARPSLFAASAPLAPASGPAITDPAFSPPFPPPR